MFLSLVGASSTVPPAAEAASISHLGTDQRVLVICVKWNDVATTRLTECQDWADLLHAELGEFFDKSTFSKSNFVFQAASTSSDGWYDLGYDSDEYDFWKVGQDAIDLADPDVDFNDYHRVAVITNWTGFGGQGGGPWWWRVDEGIESFFVEEGIEVGKREMTLSIVNEWDADGGFGVPFDAAGSVVAHELGHHLGAPTHYADVRWFPGIGRDVLTPWDVMGLSPTLNHFVGWAKQHRAWANTSSIVTVGPPSGADIDQTIRLRPLERSTGSPQVVRIPITTTPQFLGYIVENRRQVNGDENLPSDGVLISLLDENPGNVLKHIVLPDPDAPANMNEAPLDVGNAFADPAHNLTVTFVSRAGDDANVRIQYQLPPSDRPNPSITPWGAPPWETVDIWVDSEKNGWGTYRYTDGAGNPTGNGDNAWVGHDNRIYVRVTNSGPGIATNVRVEVYVNSPPGMGDRGADWEYRGTIVFPSIAAGASVEDFVIWRPSVGEHTCIKAVILPTPGELSPEDNLAQENVTAFDTSSSSPFEPVASKFEVNSPFEDRATPVRFHVRDVPRGWTVMVEPAEVELAPGGRDTVLFAVFPSGLRPDPRREDQLAEINRIGFIGRPKIEALVPYADTYIPIGGIDVWTHLVERTALTCRVGRPDGEDQQQGRRIQPPGMDAMGAGLMPLPGETRPPATFAENLEILRFGALIRPEPAPVRVGEGEVLVVTGVLRPAVAGAPIAVELIGVDQSRVVLGKTDAEGAYAIELKPPGKGDWVVRAYFAGDRTRGTTESPFCRFRSG